MRVKTVAITGVVVVICVLAYWFIFDDDGAPYSRKQYDIDTKIQGNLYRVPDVEPEMREIAQNYGEDMELVGVEYRIDSGGAGTVFFHYAFDRPGPLCARFWKFFMMSDNMTGFLVVKVSLSDAAAYEVDYEYGHGKRVSDGLPSYRSDIVKNTDPNMDVMEYYNNLIQDPAYLKSVEGKPHRVEIILKHDKIHAYACSEDGRETFYRFP